MAYASASLTQDPSHPWKMEDTCPDGQSSKSLRTGEIGDGEATSVSITFSDVSSVEFYVKASSEESCDVLAIDIDGCRYEYSGDYDWQQIYYDWGWQGEHTVTLTYAKDGSISVGSDCCWIWFDGVGQFADAGTDAKAWDMDSLHPWETSDITEWNDALGKQIPYMQSPCLQNGESSWMSYAIAKADSFRFYYIVSSESDALVVSLDGVELTTLCGACWWESYEITLPDKKRHVVTLKFEKGINSASGEDGLAYVWFAGIEKIITAGYSMNLVYPWTMDYETASGGRWGNVPLRSGAIPDGGSTSFSMTSKTSGLEYFFCKTSSEENHDI